MPSPKACMFEDCHTLQGSCCFHITTPEEQTIKAMTSNLCLNLTWLKRVIYSLGWGQQLKWLSSDSCVSGLRDTAEASPATAGLCLLPCVTFPTCWVSKVVMNRGSLKGKREVKPMQQPLWAAPAGCTSPWGPRSAPESHGDGPYQKRHKLPGINAKDEDVPNSVRTSSFTLEPWPSSVCASQERMRLNS